MNIHLPNSLLFTRCANFVFQACVSLILFSLSAFAQEAQMDVKPLIVGEKIERKVLGQEFHAYTIDLKQGQVLKVTFREKGTDVAAAFMRIADQQKISATTNSGYGFMQESLTLIVKQDAGYTLIVRAQQITKANADARYEMITTLSAQASEEDRQRTQAEQLLEEALWIVSMNDKQNFPLAITKFEQCLKIWQFLGDKYQEGIAKMHIANMVVVLGDFGKGETLFTEALALFEAARNEAGGGAVSANLAVFYTLTKNEEKSRHYRNQALKIFRSLGDTRSEELLAITNIGSQGEENTGKNYTEQIAAARAKNDKFAEASIWAKTAFSCVYDESIDYDDKMAFFERAEREALPLVEEIRDRDSEMHILLSLGVGLPEIASELEEDEEKQLAIEARASAYLRQAILLSTARSNHLIQALAYQGISAIYEDKNDRLSIFFAKKAINSIQDLRQTLKAVDRETQQELTRKLEEAYDLIAGDLFFEERFAEAQQVMNFSRDREFFDFKLVQSPTTPKLTLTDREAENAQLFDSFVERLLARQGNRLEVNYRLAADELQSLFSRLEQSFSLPASEKDVARNVPDTVDMQFALRALSSKTGKKYATLYLSSDATMILLITPESIKGFGIRNPLTEAQNYSSKLYNEIAKQVKDGAISQEEAAKRATEVKEKAWRKVSELSAEQSVDKVQDFLAILRSPNFDPRPLGATIYRNIFKRTSLSQPVNTLEADLAQYKPDVVFWSLNGNMRYIPVAALYDEEKKQYLVEKYQNVVFTRARKERFLIEPKRWTEGVGFGTSVAHGSFSALPGVRKELTTIFGDAATKQTGLFKGRVFLNQAFTRQSLLTGLQTKPAFIHIASHFSFQPGDARNSFLLLGDGTKLALLDMQQDITLFEGVDLLTLSACETAAQQPNANGKEVDGFAELAQRLGASSVIATLWKVSDDGTSKLMSEFYRLRQEKPLASKAEILQQAQLNLLNGKSSPEEGAKRRSSRGVKSAGAQSGIPFKAVLEAPFEHPYYWAPFVLFGSSQ